MKWLILAIVILAQQPAKAPEGQGGAEGKGTQVSKQGDRGDNQNQIPKQPPLSSTDNQHPAAEIQSSAPSTNSDIEIQGKIKTFTGLLVFVGFLQFFALVGQVVIYCRQAKIMARQAYEMKRSRSYMRLQWKAMGVQAAHMGGQLTEMQESRKIENKTLILQYRPKIIVRNAKAVGFSFDLGKPWEFAIRFQIVNVGGSPAYIAPGSHIQLASSIGHDVRKIELKWGDECPVSNVTLQPGQDVTVEESLATGTLFSTDWENFRLGLQSRAFRFIHLTGVIYYTDDLGIPRSTGISREFDTKTEEFVPRKESEHEYSD